MFEVFKILDWDIYVYDMYYILKNVYKFLVYFNFFLLVILFKDFRDDKLMYIFSDFM